MKYTIWQNIRYVYKASFEKAPRIKWLLIINFFTELLIPFSATIITTIVVYILTSSASINQYIFVILGISFFIFVISGLRNWSYITYTFENIFTRNSTFMIRLTEHQLATDYANVEPKQKRDIINKAFEAIGSNLYGVELMMRSAPETFFNFIGMLIYGALIVTYSPIVLAILIAMTIVNLILTTKANKFLASKRDDIGKIWEEKYYLSKDATNHVYGKDIRVYQLRDWFERIFVSLTKERKLISKQIESKFLFANMSNTVFLLVRDIIAYSTLVVLVLQNAITVTTFTFLVGIVTGFTLWLNGFVKHFNNLRSSNIATNEYRVCLETDNVFNHEQGVDITTLTKPISIEFKDVSFKYPDSEENVLEHISFTIQAGEKIALVGNNGAGKTTLVKLLCGLYQPTQGSILVNNIPINQFNLEDYMSLLSVVFQDSEPLAFTIEQNIACSMTNDIDKTRLWSCIEQAGLQEKLQSLPLQEQTYITEMFNKDGIKLSGGETQKLMLARALYKDASLLILDEPTAALDPISEEQMYLRYNEFLAGNTSIFISHRLSSTKFCDQIFFLHNKTIAEIGTHNELMQQDGLYKELFAIQSKYYKEEAEHETHQFS